MDILDPATLAAAVDRVLDPSKRLSLWPLLTSLVIAVIVFRTIFGRRSNPRRFRRYLFSRAVWRHRSTGVDVQMAAFSAVWSLIRKLMVGVTVASFAAMVAALLADRLGPPAIRFGGGAGTTVLLAAILFVLTDFSTYLVHRISHRVPVLWAFHRVHHSAEVLSPLTLLRVHPVFSLLSRGLDLVIVAPLQGLALYFWPQETGLAVAVGVGWAYGLFALAGANLRHSQIWLSFGPLERLLVSPAQHQIHHSAAREHWDRNYGEVLAIWDWMFGTLVVAPRRRGRLRYGIGGGIAQPHPTLWHALIEPFQNAAAILCDRKHADPVALTRTASRGSS